MRKILPQQTVLFQEKLRRNHAPTAKRFEAFRDCLRWDFGFTCAICNLHEIMLVPYGLGCEKTGQMSIEHLIAQSSGEGKANQNIYENCLLVCRYCNGSRGNRFSVEGEEGGKLINPVTHVWAEHFRVEGARILPNEEDLDADYTARAYKINDSIRVTRREHLGETIRSLLESLAEGREEYNTLRARASDPALPEDDIHLFKSQQGRARVRLEKTIQQLKHFKAVPIDAPQACQCGRTHQVQDAIVRTWQDLPDLKVEA